MSTLLIKIIEKETDFDHFYEFIHDETHLKTWINQAIYPRSFANDIIIQSLLDLDHRKHDNAIRELAQKIKNININLQFSSSNDKFSEIEKKAEIESYYEETNVSKLIDKYDQFFGLIGDIRVYTKIKEHVDILEFGRLTLNNINIFNEALTEFIKIEKIPFNNNLNVFFEPTELNSSAILREQMKKRIMKIITEKMFL